MWAQYNKDDQYDRKCIFSFDNLAASDFSVVLFRICHEHYQLMGAKDSLALGIIFIDRLYTRL